MISVEISGGSIQPLVGAVPSPCQMVELQEEPGRLVCQPAQRVQTLTLAVTGLFGPGLTMLFLVERNEILRGNHWLVLGMAGLIVGLAWLAFLTQLLRRPLLTFDLATGTILFSRSRSGAVTLRIPREHVRRFEVVVIDHGDDSDSRTPNYVLNVVTRDGPATLLASVDPTLPATILAAVARFYPEAATRDALTALRAASPALV